MREQLLTLILCLLATCAWKQASAQEQQDTIVKHDPAEYLSNTLPVLYINTENETPIVDKENYIQGTYYLDANGCGDYTSVGTEENPLPLQIRGRGNSSWWNFDKKPYRLKLESKASLLGMPKSKHWVLLAEAHDWLGHGRNYLNLKISEKLGMPFTTKSIPCEVVLNGDYIGMYFLTEQIRIAKERINITEQDDEETNSTLITGGWLLEIDNYTGDNQVLFTDPKKPDHLMKVTYHSPEVLSNEQLNYLTNLMNNVNASVNIDDKSSREWEKYIDIDALARYYILIEAIDDQEGFSGSCWFYKDRGDSTKLIWGPFWDSGSTLGNRNMNFETINFFYEEEPKYAYNHWIGEIVKFPRFQIATRKWWKKYRDEVFPTMQAEVDAFGQLTEAALASEFLRWDDLSATNQWYYRRKYMTLLSNRRDFFISKWDAAPATNKWTTYYSDVNLSLPEGATAFVVNGINDQHLDLTPVNYIPANVGVLLFGINELETIATTPYDGETQQVSSILLGSLSPQIVHDGYVLFNNQFVLAPTDTPLEPNRCYIPISSDESTPTFIEFQRLYGDVNGDGFVTSADVTAIYAILLGSGNDHHDRADVNGDGEITAADVTAIYEILLGIY